MNLAALRIALEGVCAYRPILDTPVVSLARRLLDACVRPAGEEALEAYTRLFCRLREEGFTYNLQEEIYNRGEFWLEVMPGNITKASGARRVKEMTGADKLVCFGDNLNDAALFREADECYAVKNAVGVLRDMATGVIGSYEEDGVARWLEENAARFLVENK